MKAKVFKYRSDGNTVVAPYMELEPYAENVYLSLSRKNEYGNEDDDCFHVVCRIENVYFSSGQYSRRFLNGENRRDETAAYCRNWIADTLQGAERGAFVRLISVRVFEALGLDTTPLVQAREAYKRRQEQKRREQEEKEAEERRAREEQHQRLLDEQKQKFLDGERITGGMFLEITGHIQVPDMTMESGSTEQMVQYGKYVYCNCWSYQNRIIKIDTETDQVVDELKIGIQPTSLVMDKYNKMWTITDGGYEGSPYGYEAPSLYRIDAETFTVEKQFKFKLGDWPSEVQLNGDRDKLYWINKDIWCMDVTASRVPVRPFLEYSGTIYYGLTVNPANGEVYIADAIDYQQQGMIYRYSLDGELIDEFYVGIIPGAFCWK